MTKGSFVVVAWHNSEQRDKFLAAWGIKTVPDWLILQQDKNKEGCARTKNKGIEEAIRRGAVIVVIIDDDCYPNQEIGVTPYLLTASDFDAPVLQRFVEAHEDALEPQWVDRFRVITEPRSRGTPYLSENRKILMPTAGSYGYWKEIGDYCGVGQLAYGARTEMKFDQRPIYGDYFSGSGMNFAFRVKDWWPIAQLINVSRFDDIWQSWIWQKIAYSRGYCFNLGGPLVKHSRQSNVWSNLRDEVKYLEENETLWRKIAECPSNEYEQLRRLLPV